MFISFFTGKVMLFYGISLIMKEKSNASALAILLLFSERPPAFDRVSPCIRLRLALRSVVPRPAFAKKYRD